jgi:hypothetical protein
MLLGVAVPAHSAGRVGEIRGLAGLPPSSSLEAQHCSVLGFFFFIGSRGADGDNHGLFDGGDVPLD